MMWATTGIGLCVGLSVLGAGWYVIASERARAASEQLCNSSGLWSRSGVVAASFP